MSIAQLYANGRALRTTIRNFPFFSPLLRFVEYKRRQSLGKYGLQVDDIAIEYPAVKTALSRISAEDRVARQQRIYRAFDLSAKKKVLYVPEDPYARPYLKKHMETAQVEETERDVINHY